MKTSRLFLTASLFLVLLVSACAPAATSPTPESIAATPAQNAAPTQSGVQPEATLPIATSRGPNLEATDPTMVKLASGGLQLVEFFRFT